MTAALIALCVVVGALLFAVLYLCRSLIATARHGNDRLLNAVLAKSTPEFTAMERAARPTAAAAALPPEEPKPRIRQPAGFDGT